MKPAASDTYWFWVSCGPADLTFGIPAAAAKDMVRNWERNVRASKSNPRPHFEDGVHQVMQADEHTDPAAQQQFAMMVATLCLTSEEAQEDPAARGIQMECSTSPVPSWFGSGITVNMVDPVDTEGRSLKWFVYYRTHPGKADIDSLVAAFRARVMPSTLPTYVRRRRS